jgi:hypothetical protein
MSLRKKSHLLTKDQCPNCTKVLDAVTGAEGDKTLPPKSGDVTICFGCHSVLEFSPDLMLRTVDVDTLPAYLQKTVKVAVQQIKDAKVKGGVNE